MVAVLSGLALLAAFIACDARCLSSMAASAAPVAACPGHARQEHGPSSNDGQPAGACCPALVAAKRGSDDAALAPIVAGPPPVGPIETLALIATSPTPPRTERVVPWGRVHLRTRHLLI